MASLVIEIYPMLCNFVTSYTIKFVKSIQFLACVCWAPLTNHINVNNCSNLFCCKYFHCLLFQKGCSLSRFHCSVAIVPGYETSK